MSIETAFQYSRQDHFSQQQLEEQVMSRKQYSLSKKLVVATALALGASGVAIADGYADNSMSRLGGDGYAYFHQPVPSNTAANAAWRQSHPNGLSEAEVQALSSSDLSAFTSKLNPPVFASAAADPSWRQSHPNGLTETELQAAGSSSLAMFENRTGSGFATDQTNVAESPSKQMFAARLANFFHPGSGKTGTNSY